MSAVTFDTLKFVKTLEAGGLAVEAAESIAMAYRDASVSQELITKKDLQIEFAPVKSEISAVRADIQMLKWMGGIITGGIVALVLKSFF